MVLFHVRVAILVFFAPSPPPHRPRVDWSGSILGGDQRTLLPVELSRFGLINGRVDMLATLALRQSRPTVFSLSNSLLRFPSCVFLDHFTVDFRSDECDGLWVGGIFAVWPKFTLFCSVLSSRVLDFLSKWLRIV